MPKLIRPEEGRPADLLLDEVICDMGRYSGNPENVLELVNPGVCLSESQQSWLRRQFSNSTPKYGRVDLTEEQMAAVINSFRLECVDCLGQNCPRRDPVTSVSEIKKRDEFYCIHPDSHAEILGAGLKFSKSGMWDVLINAKIKTVDDLCNNSEKDLLALPGASSEFVDELKKYLSEYGLQLKDEPKNE